MISDKKAWKKTSYNQRFMDNSINNYNLMEKIGGWKERVHDNTLNFSGISHHLDKYYHLYNFVSGRIIFMDKSYGERGGDKKSNFFSGDSRIRDHWVKENRFKMRLELTLVDLDMQVKMKKGDEGEKDISCDSKFMLGIMDELGNATRNTYHSIRVADEEIIYLVMDNEGGHETNEAILEYIEYMATRYNIVVHQQVPWPPKTNMLNLGEWMTVKSKVEKYHRLNIKQHEALDLSSKKAWHAMELKKLTNIWNLLLVVLGLVVQYQRGNDLVKSNRALKSVPEKKI